MKLTAKMKEAVVQKAVDAVFKDRFDENTKKLVQMGIDYLNTTGRVWAREIPDRFSPYINLRSSLYLYREHDSNLPINLPEQFATSHNHSETLGSYGKEYKHPAADEYAALVVERDAFANDVKALLASCSTLKQLEETAPELAKYVPEPVVPGGALVAVETVNKVRAALSRSKA